jgi:hypothetical protein
LKEIVLHLFLIIVVKTTNLVKMNQIYFLTIII